MLRAAAAPLDLERSRANARRIGHIGDPREANDSRLITDNVRRFSEGESIAIKALSEEVLHLDAGRHDPLTQRIALQRVVIRESGVRLFPIICRYAWPSELDLMARLADLRLRERWADWRRRPFTAASARSISVYASEQRDEIG